MRLDELVFVTSNLGKLREAEAVLGCRLNHRSVDVEEIQSMDLEEIVQLKAKSAHRSLEAPVLVEDTSLELAGLGGFPGPLIRWLLTSVGPEGICRIAHCFSESRATVRCIACAADGRDVVLGIGVVHGEIAQTPRGRQGFGWDSVFIPDGFGGRTYGEMDEAEKNEMSHRRRALEALRDALDNGAS